MKKLYIVNFKTASGDKLQYHALAENEKDFCMDWVDACKLGNVTIDANTVKIHPAKVYVCTQPCYITTLSDIPYGSRFKRMTYKDTKNVVAFSFTNDPIMTKYNHSGDLIECFTDRSDPVVLSQDEIVAYAM